MVFLVFSEVPEMSSEVAGPGPTHGRSNLPELTRDLLLVPSRPMPDACYPLVCLLCVFQEVEEIPEGHEPFDAR